MLFRSFARLNCRRKRGEVCPKLHLINYLNTVHFDTQPRVHGSLSGHLHDPEVDRQPRSASALSSLDPYYFTAYTPELPQPMLPAIHLARQLMLQFMGNTRNNNRVKANADNNGQAPQNPGPSNNKGNGDDGKDDSEPDVNISDIGK